MSVSNCQLSAAFFNIHRNYAKSIPRPFSVRYNPYTLNVEILNSKTQLESLLKNINLELIKVTDALHKMH